MQPLPGVERHLVVPTTADPPRGCERWHLRQRQGLQVGLDDSVTVLDLLVVIVIQRQGLLSGKQVLGLPRPLQRPRDHRFTRLTAVIA